MDQAKFALILFMMLLFPAALIWGQVVYRYEDELEVMQAGQSLELAWVGGLNSAQYGHIDADLDGFLDLAVFDRTSNKLHIFIQKDQGLTYDPDYSAFFPKDLDGWVLFQDYNCDGRIDIFTNTLFGMKVYRNTSEQQLSFKLVADPIYTIGASGEVNLQVNITDIPGIADLDNDGDLDILVYDFSTGGYIRHHKNLSMETFGHCDSLYFQRVTTQWGKFEECECDIFAFNGNTCSGNGRINHAGGKSMLLLDLDGDQDKDLLMSQEDCSKMYFLENKGTAQEALMQDFSMTFPYEQNPIHFDLFPAAYWVDADLDGIKDLLASPNLTEEFSILADFKHSSWFYKNTGTNEDPQFQFVQKDFLQGQMIDVGSAAVPFMADYDGDGDQDLFVAGNGHRQEDINVGSIHLFINQSEQGKLTFSYQDPDYLNLSSLGLINLKPVFRDLNQDQAPDLIVPATRFTNYQTEIYYYINQAPAGSPFKFDLEEGIRLNMDFRNGDNPVFTDVNQDGKTDVLLGKATGRIEYYQNQGTASQPQFSLVNREFAGIDDNYTRRSPVPQIIDLNGDRQSELVIMDESGLLKIIRNFLDQPETEIVNYANQVLQQELPFTAGKGSWPVFSNIFQENLPALLVGNVQGGMSIYRPLNAKPKPEKRPIRLTIYPIPQPDSPFIHIAVNQPAKVEIISMLGQTLYSFELSGQEELKLNKHQLSRGIYVVKASVSPRNFVSERLLINY
ncbi:MAG: T9SS type A sorting domain-containing protein [Candidatus Cyclobacteriaceae bacterium M3_2C_046]